MSVSFAIPWTEDYQALQSMGFPGKNTGCCSISLSCVQFFVIKWTVAYQAPLSMGFSRQGYWSELPFPSPGELPDPGMEPAYPALPVDSLPLRLQGSPGRTFSSVQPLSSV